MFRVVTLAAVVGWLSMTSPSPHVQAGAPPVEANAPAYSSQPPAPVPSEALSTGQDPALGPMDCYATAPSGSCLTNVALGVRLWLSWAESERSHSANLPPPVGFVDPISVLRWERMASEAVELSASALLWERMVLSTEIGMGGISGGKFTDQDFLISGEQGLFSETVSPITDDDLFYFNVEVGWRFFESRFCTLDGLIGYQFWREKYLAEGGSDVVPGLFPLPAGPVISEEFTWQGFRIGGQGSVMIAPRLALKSRLMFMPIPHFRMEDVHFLREDFLKDPSGIGTASGGFGVMAEIRLTYWLWNWVYLDVAYRIWDATSGSGETMIRTADGDIQVPFNEGSTTRDGLIIGLSAHFKPVLTNTGSKRQGSAAKQD